MILFFLVLLTPFIQLGVTYYVSISTLSFIGLFLNSHIYKNILNKNIYQFVIVISLISFLMLINGIILSDFDDYYILKSLRQALFFFLICFILYSNISFNLKKFKYLINSLLIISISLLFLVLIQYFFVSKGIYLGFSEDLYVMNTGTIPSELDLLYSKIRPAGTFGEPSYLAAYLVCITFSLFKLYDWDKKAKLILILNSITIFLSMSMLGVVSILMVILYYFFKTKRNIKYKMMLIMLSVPFIFYLVLDLLGERINSISFGEDASYNDRILYPLKMLPELLMNHPYGFLFDTKVLNIYINEGLSAVLHNSIFNIIFSYGVVGFVCIFILFFSAKNMHMKFLVFILMIQNGGFLSIDKAVIIILTVLIMNSADLYIREKNYNIKGIKL